MAGPTARYSSVAELEIEFRRIGCKGASSFVGNGFAIDPAIASGNGLAFNANETVVVDDETLTDFKPQVSPYYRLRSHLEEFIRNGKVAFGSLRRRDKKERRSSSNNFLVRGVLMIGITFFSLLSLIGFFFVETERDVTAGLAAHNSASSSSPFSTDPGNKAVYREKGNVADRIVDASVQSKAFRMADELVNYIGEVKHHNRDLHEPSAVGVMNASLHTRVHPGSVKRVAKTFSRESSSMSADSGVVSRQIESSGMVMQSEVTEMVLLHFLRNELVRDSAGLNLRSSASSEERVEEVLQSARFMKNPFLTSLLVQFTESESYTVRIAAIRSLQSDYHLSFPSVQEALLRKLSDSEFLVRGFAAKSLAARGDNETHTLLIEKLVEEPHPVVRRVIEGVLRFGKRV
jgi:hypothetical protein